MTLTWTGGKKTNKKNTKERRKAMNGLKGLAEKAHKNAKEKGFWAVWEKWEAKYEEGAISLSLLEEVQELLCIRALALIHEELSEALKALRGKDEDNNLPEELADTVIRVMDLSGGLGINLEAEVIKKMHKNGSREYKHGKKF